MKKKLLFIISSIFFILSCNNNKASSNVSINEQDKYNFKLKDQTVSYKIDEIPDTAKKAYFASGCFWGTEYWFEKMDGVYAVISGYAGGHKENPTYQEVVTGLTGHLETVEVIYDPQKVTYEDLVKLYYETHNFEQKNGQGPDIGSQYLSAIFYQNDEEKAMAEKYFNLLASQGYKPATMIRPYKNFYPAEDYHQDYYERKGSLPYCHFYNKIF